MRKEEIEKVANDYCTEYNYRNHVKGSDGAPFTHFVQGAHWADNNPKSPWVDVHDKLPECGKEVVVTDGTYCHVNAWEGSSSYTGWRYGAGRITHWCPIPSLPEKEDYGD